LSQVFGFVPLGGINGLKVIHVPTPNDDSFVLGMIVRAGSRFESEASCGISHFLEHMMFRGSKQYPTFTQLAAAFEWLGGEWNAETGHEYTQYWYSGIRHTCEEVMRLFAEFFAYPTLSDIDIERKIIQREIQGELNEFGHSMDTDYHIATLIWPDTSMARPMKYSGFLFSFM